MLFQSEFGDGRLLEHVFFFFFFFFFFVCLFVFFLFFVLLLFFCFLVCFLVVVVVVVLFLFYGPSTHLRSFRARSVNLATLFLGKPPRQFTSA